MRGGIIKRQASTEIIFLIERNTHILAARIILTKDTLLRW